MAFLTSGHCQLVCSAALGSALGGRDRGLRCSRQQVNGPHHRPDQPFDVPSEMRASRWPIDQIDPPFRACRPKGPRAEIAAIVDVEAERFALRGPRNIAPQFPQKFRLRGNRLCQSKRHGQTRRGLQRGVVSSYHPRCDVDRQRDPRPANWLTLKTVDKNDVRGRMVDLHDLEWLTGLVLAYDWRKFLTGRLCALPCLRNFAGIHRIQTTQNRPPCLRLQALLPAGAADLCHNTRQARSLPAQEIEAKMLFDHRFDLAGYQNPTCRAAPLPRYQSAGAPPSSASRFIQRQTVALLTPSSQTASLMPLSRLPVPLRHA
ncbi:hypothetical protein SAMN05444959_12346 [Paracoccus seriniphilus]|uniref:Uncharacterized protein n=1 Tax=Paracoccus seriniphilus TaxID=184748 RepID=A0A239Q271_9RHOB|nr:hypothetical protein SAMN05444959_12346 [Paracoccus seriniphilus]